MHDQPNASRPELLAPAGDEACLVAALHAGANAVYLGLRTLNARRGARNFLPDEFARAVQLAHERGARVYLTLNIDLSQRELGQAARILELARQAGADAVLIRDPALLAFRPLYPQLEFHFSTQTCMANSADVAAAAELGASRVVLAREMSLAEIAAASSVPGIRTEVFVHGALCFTISGRCLLSSWIGGRSGNRGTCTSPCRVGYSIGGRSAGTPLSMRDLSAIGQLKELATAGVGALKIEGRLKNPDWVRKAVDLYRRALAGENAESLQNEAADLGDYAGRTFTSGYLDSQRTNLTALASGRAPSAISEESQADEPSAETEPDGPPAGTYDLAITIADKAIACRCAHAGRSVEWSIPKTVIRRAHKAVAVSTLLESLDGYPIQGCVPDKLTTNDPSFLLVPRAANAFPGRISSALHQLRKSPDDEVRIIVSDDVRQILNSLHPAEDPVESLVPSAPLSLGDEPDRIRLDASDVAAFFRQVRSSGSWRRPAAVIVEGLTAHALSRVRSHCPVPMIAALPPVFFESDIPEMRALLAACACVQVHAEVNTWGGWRLAREASVPAEAGPGLGILNSLAARVLTERGLEGVTISLEADGKRMEAMTANCPVPTSLVIFGRPRLAISRAQLPRPFLNQVCADRRGVRIVPRLEHGLWAFRPITPFDLRGIHNSGIRVHHLVMDLSASPDPADEWLNPPPKQSVPFRFNYDRTLA